MLNLVRSPPRRLEGRGGTGARREFLISKGWIQAAVLVILFGFFVLGLLAYRTYQAQAAGAGAGRRRSPARSSSPATTSAEGQKVFLHNGLMEYGSVFGHGAYLGPDFTADYLRRSSRPRSATPTAAPARTRPRSRRSRTSARNRYDEDAGTVTLHAPPRPTPSASSSPYYSDFFSDPTTEHGLRPDAITDPTELHAADRLLRLDGLGGVDRAARARLLVHEQLAAGAARRQQADRERDRLVGRSR